MVEFANWIQDPKIHNMAHRHQCPGWPDMRQDRAGDPAQAADLVGLVGGDRRQDDLVHSCPQQRFQASLAILAGSRNGKRIDHLVTYPADNLRAAASFTTS
jgi:hypothetical protein